MLYPIELWARKKGKIQIFQREQYSPKIPEYFKKSIKDINSSESQEYVIPARIRRPALARANWRPGESKLIVLMRSPTKAFGDDRSIVIPASIRRESQKVLLPPYRFSQNLRTIQS